MRVGSLKWIKGGGLVYVWNDAVYKVHHKMLVCRKWFSFYKIPPHLKNKKWLLMLLWLVSLIATFPSNIKWSWPFCAALVCKVNLSWPILCCLRLQWQPCSGFTFLKRFYYENNVPVYVCREAGTGINVIIIYKPWTKVLSETRKLDGFIWNVP